MASNWGSILVSMDHIYGGRGELTFSGTVPMGKNPEKNPVSFGFISSLGIHGASNSARTTE